MRNGNKESRLTGKWQVVRNFIASDETGKSLTLYEDYFVEFAAGGTIVETYGDKITETTYRFDDDTCTIEILAADSQSSSIFGAGNAIFRVVPLNDHEMYLRKPHGIEINGDFETILLYRI